MTQQQTKLSVSDHEGNVVLTLPSVCDTITIDPETARQLGEAIARSSYYCRYGIQPDDKKSVISELKRTTLITRATHIIRSMTDQKIMPGKVAAEVVDVILSEVL